MSKPAQISIIIPTLNEGSHIGKLIEHLKQGSRREEIEIIVSDGQSTDNTVQVARAFGAKVVLCPTKGRAYQMNFAAAIAEAPILYFIHADSFPPVTFSEDILHYIKKGYELGRYQTSFESDSLLLKINAFFTRFDFDFCYGGDQTLFISADLFKKIGGFNSSMKIMEDYDIVRRARAMAKYKIMKNKVLVSARKYQSNSWLAVQLANLKIMRMFARGASQEDMIRKYNELINYR